MTPRLTLTIACILHAAITFGQASTIKGSIMSSDNRPAVGITVELEKTKWAAVTDSLGFYEIGNIRPGTYTLRISTIGINGQQRVVNAETGKSTTTDFTINYVASELQEIIVSARRQRITSKESEQVARMPLANLENPQVYSITGKELLKQQVVTSLVDALKSAPGVIPNLYPSGGLGIMSRGFSTGIGARNGLQSTIDRSGADVSNIERIEYIKGPSGTLFGEVASSFGGVVNIVTKKPYENYGGNVDFIIGSFGLARLTTDVNAPLNKEKTSLFRMNAALHRQYSFINNFGFSNTVTVAPSFLFKVNDKFSVLLDGEFYNTNATRPTYNIVNPESGYSSFKQLPLPFRTSFYDNDLDAKTQSQRLFADATYKINNNWTSRTSVSFVNEQVAYSYQSYNTWFAKDSVSRWVGIWGPVRNTHINAQQNFTGKFKTGPLKHTLLAGFSYTNYNSDGLGKYAPNEFDTVDTRLPYSFINRTYADKLLLQPENINDWGIIKNDFYGAYVSDVVNIGDRLFAMLSLRYDRYVQILGGRWGEPYKQKSWSPKLGLVYQLVKKQVSIFANYMNGFQSLAPAIQQPDGSILSVKPVYAKQWESGVKAEVFNGKLNSTFSYYEITIDNALRIDDNLFNRQDGQQKSKGFEWELLANPINGLDIIVGYGYNENKIVKASANEGKLVSGAPRNMLNAWFNYKISNGFLKNFGIGAGGNSVSHCYFNESNTIAIPSYTVINATLFYDIAKWRAAFKLNNIGDKQYWDNWGIANPTRNMAINIMLRF